MGVHKHSKQPDFFFVIVVYILMHSREEWVLVQLGSQHKRVERPLRSVFPDYLSVSSDYGEKFVYKHSETIQNMLKINLFFKKFGNFAGK